MYLTEKMTSTSITAGGSTLPRVFIILLSRKNSSKKKGSARTKKEIQAMTIMESHIVKLLMSTLSIEYKGKNKGCCTQADGSH